MAQLPPVPFPGTLPSSPITYLGNTYTYANGYLVQTVYDCVNGVASFRWRLYDYANAHLITDLEAQLMGINAEVMVTIPNVWARAAADAFIAGVVAGNLGAALVANCWPALDAANLSLTNAQNKLTADSATITADQVLVTQYTNQLATDQATLTAAQNSVTTDQTNLTNAQTQLDTDTAASASLIAADQAAVTAATSAVAAAQATITAIEGSF